MKDKLTAVITFSFITVLLDFIQNYLSTSGTGTAVSLEDILLRLTGGLMIAVLFAWLLPQVRLQRTGVTLIVWIILYVIHIFSNKLEAAFFASNLISLHTLAVPAVTSGIGAVAAAWLFAGNDKTTLHHAFADYLKQRRALSWLWRLTLSSVAYFPVYIMFGMTVAPFVTPYYNNPAYGLHIPPFSLIIPLELVRGFIYTVALLPLFSAMKADRKTVSIAAALVLYIPGAFVPLLSQTSLPVQIVPFHMLEILGDSVVYGIIMTRLLYRPAHRT